MAPETCKTSQMRDRAGKAHPRQRAVVGSTAALWSGRRRRLGHWGTGTLASLTCYGLATPCRAQDHILRETVPACDQVWCTVQSTYPRVNSFQPYTQLCEWAENQGPARLPLACHS